LKTLGPKIIPDNGLTAPVFPGTVQLTSGGKLLIPDAGDAPSHRRPILGILAIGRSSQSIFGTKKPAQEIKVSIENHQMQ